MPLPSILPPPVMFTLPPPVTILPPLVLILPPATLILAPPFTPNVVPSKVKLTSPFIVDVPVAVNR